MTDAIAGSTASDAAYISTGHLPASEVVQSLISRAYNLYKGDENGQTSQVYPALARAPSELFGICVAENTGHLHEIGDTRHEFSIMSVSKPFVFALICDQIGPEKGARTARRQRNGPGLQLARGD